MGVSAVNNYGNSSPLSTVLTSTIIGGGIGYWSKTAIPLRDREKKDINYRAIVNASRKDVNLQKVNSFKILKERTAAQDEFIKMIDNKNQFKNPSLDTLIERLGGNENELGKSVKNIINTSNNKNMSIEELLDEVGKSSKDAQTFEKTFESQNIFSTLSKEAIYEKLGGKDAPIAKKVLSILENKKDTIVTFDEVKKSLGESSDEVKTIRKVASWSNVFNPDNIKLIVKKLGGENSQAGKEFNRIIAEVNETASSVSRDLLKSCHKLMKEKRYTAPLVVTGAAAGFTAAFLHNIFSHKTES